MRQLSTANGKANGDGHDAEELTRLKGQFLASLNHEIRTPLSGILGMTDLLLETDMSEEQREYVSTARLCAENLLEVLNSTLEYSALMAGNVEIECADLHLHGTVRSVADQQRAKAEAKGLALHCRIEDSLPELAMGDAVRIRQLLVPLIDNAIKFTHQGSVEIRALSDDGNSEIFDATFEIRDTGIGIPPEHVKLVFDSFQQVESGLARTYPGLGLGMAIAHKVAQLLQGSMVVESEPGHGTCVRVRIPMRAVTNPELSGAAARQFQAGESSRHQILVVDDNSVAQQVVSHILHKRHYDVDCVDGGAEALDAVMRRHYDLILMDLQMPGMNGIEAAAAIRLLNGYAQVPILAFTANSSDEYRYLCREYGMQAFVAKPVQAEELYAALDRFLQ